MKSIKSQDYYEILGISRLASQDDIRKAFDLCKHTYQDDSLATYSLFSDDESRDMFSLMSQAYEILNDPSSRREYDSYLSQKEGRPVGENEGERMVASMIGVGKPAREYSAPAAKPTGRGESPPPPKRKNAGGAKPAAENENANGSSAAEKLLESVDAITGPVLKKIRTMQGISLETLSEQTKIRKTYLQYLEEEEYQFLPAPVYIKGFVNNIASILGIPPKRAAEDYMAQYNRRQDGN